MLQDGTSSCTMRTLRVLRIDEITVSRSQGTKLRRSISSTAASPESLSIACSAISMQFPHATTVKPLPERLISAVPRGTASTISDNSSLRSHSKCLGKRIMAGSLPCIAVQNKPAASEGVDGTTTLNPGK